MLFLQLLLLTFIIEVISKRDNCPIYSCENIEKGFCSIKEGLKYQLQECPHFFQCDFKEEDEKSLCIVSQYEYNYKAFIGGKCEKNSDCISNKCEINECVGIFDNTCQSTDDCKFGSYCKNGQCESPASLGNPCTLDEECVWPSGCFDSKCTQYFSIKNKAKGDDSKPYFCKSGRSYNNLCNSIQDSTQSSCSNAQHCTHQDIFGDSVTLTNSCVCSISSEPKQICKSGDVNNPYWETVLDLLKQSLNSEYLNKCNAKEKRPGFCREALRNDWTIRNKNIELTKSLILFENSIRMDKTIPCSLKSVLKFDDTPPQPKNNIFQCPEYHCNDKQFELEDKTCAYSNNTFNQKGDGITVELQNICSKGYKCDYQSSKIYLNWTVNSTCKEIPTQKSWRDKYPGEDCTSHLQCLPAISGEIRYCIDGICSGENDNCTHHRDCSKGYFCNGIKCQKQKKENKQCLNEFECYNYLGCLNNTCVPYYSLSNGTYLNKTNPDPTLCQSGIINEETNQCAGIDYYNVDEKQKDEKGFVECSVGQLCNYTTGYYIKNKPVVMIKVCECGFRDKGKAYCPIPQTVSKLLYLNASFI